MMSRTRRWFGATVLGVAVIVGGVEAALAQAPLSDEQAEALEEAKRLSEEVVRLHKAGQYDNAVPLAKKALDIFEKVMGPEHADVAAALRNLAALYAAKGDYVHAEPAYVRALAIQEKVLGLEHPDVAELLNDLAALYHDKGDYARAEPLYLRSLAIQEKVLGPDHPDVATSLSNLGALYKSKDDDVHAEPLYLRALAIQEKVFGPDHPNVTPPLNNLAELYQAKGDYAHAEQLFLRALVIREKALGTEHTDVADLLNNVAMLYHAKGEYAQAEKLLLRALAIQEKVLGPEHSAVARVLDNLAVLYDAFGDFARGEPLHLRALAIREKVLGPEHPDVAKALNNLAVLYSAKGDYTHAEALYARTFIIFVKVWGPESPAMGRLLINIASLHYTNGDYARAKPIFLLALNILEKVLGPEHPDVAASLNSVAALYQLTGDYAGAEPLLLRALAIREKFLGPQHPDVATSLHNLAVLYQATGDYTRAEPLLLRALAIFEKILHPDEAVALEHLAMLRCACNDRDSAISSLVRAATIRDAIATEQLAVGTIKQKRQYVERFRLSTHSAISLHVQSAPHSDDAKRLAVRTILRHKGLTLEATANSLWNLRARLKPEDQAKFDNWHTLTAQYSAMSQRGPATQGFDAFRTSLQSLNTARERAESELSFVSKDLKGQLKPVTIEQVQAALAKDAALVELFQYRPFNPKAAGTKNQWGKDRFVAYVLHPSGKLNYADLGDAQPIENAVRAFRLALSTEARDPKPAGRDLYQLVLAPIVKLLGQTKHVYLSPDGALSLVPFGAMLAPDDHHYVAEHLAITYLTTGRDLVRVSSRPHQEPAAVFSAPNYEAGDPGTPRIARPFPLLWGGAAEGHAVKARQPKAMLFDGVKATESALKALHGPEVVHISTHGFFTKDLPGLHEPTRERFGMQPASPVEDAMLRSGLAFAGANRGGVDKEDGILTALEASQLDLWGTKLVVLSACDTGRGDVQNGDGVYGLRRAFTIAGAETVVMSLWSIDANATTDLITQYYEGLKNGGGRAEALRQAQLAMLADSKRSHPHYWASFIVSGNDNAMDGHPVAPTFGRITRGGTCGACEIGTHKSIGSGVWLGIAIIGAALRLRRRGARVENGR